LLIPSIGGISRPALCEEEAWAGGPIMAVSAREDAADRIGRELSRGMTDLSPRSDRRERQRDERDAGYDEIGSAPLERRAMRREAPRADCDRRARDHADCA